MAVVTRMMCTSYEGIFSIQEELPLHLCRLIAMVLPVVIWLKNIKWLNTLSLIIVGTLRQDHYRRFAIYDASLQLFYLLDISCKLSLDSCLYSIERLILPQV